MYFIFYLYLFLGAYIVASKIMDKKHKLTKWLGITTYEIWPNSHLSLSRYKHLASTIEVPFNLFRVWTSGSCGGTFDVHIISIVFSNLGETVYYPLSFLIPHSPFRLESSVSISLIPVTIEYRFCSIKFLSSYILKFHEITPISLAGLSFLWFCRKAISKISEFKMIPCPIGHSIQSSCLRILSGQFLHAGMDLSILRHKDVVQTFIASD